MGRKPKVAPLRLVAGRGIMLVPNMKAPTNNSPKVSGAKPPPEDKSTPKSSAKSPYLNEEARKRSEAFKQAMLNHLPIPD